MVWKGPHGNGSTSSSSSSPTRTSRGYGVTSSRPNKPSPTRTSRGQGVVSSRPDRTVSHTPQRDRDHANEFASISPSMQAANEQRAREQEKQDRVQAQMLQNTLDRAQREREAKGNVYKPNLSPKGSALGSGDKMAADFFGMDKPGALHAWTDESGKGHTGTLDEMAAALDMGKVGAFGEPSDVDKYKYGMFDYGEFGYGPGSQWDEELIQFFGGKPQEGFSHAQLTEYLYGIGAAGIDDSMFLGGKPGQTGFGPGEKPAWYGQPRTGSTGGGGDGGGGGWGGGYGGGGGGGGSSYGGPPKERPQFPGQAGERWGAQNPLQQAMINIHGGAGFKQGFARGGIVSLVA